MIRLHSTKSREAVSGLTEMVYSHFGLAVETHVDNRGPSTNRGIAQELVVLPGAGAQLARTAGIARDRASAGQADLPAVGMTTQHDIETGMCCMTIDFGGMG